VATAQIIDVIFRGQNQAEAAIRDVERGLGAVDKAGEGISKSDQALQTMAATLSRIGPLLLAAFGVSAVSDLAAKFVAANVEVEKFTRAVTQISGSSNAAGQELDYLRSVSDRLGLSTRGTADAYVGLLAATRNTSLEGAQTRTIFESIATAMSLLGRSSADTEGALLAIQQIISKGTVSSEELRGQLGERLPGAFGIAARAVGVTTEQLGKMLEQGQVIAADFLPKFAAELNATFGRPENVDTYVAAVNRLGNAFDEALQAIGQTGAFDLLTSFLKVATPEIKEFGVVWDDMATRFGAFRNLLRGGSWDVFIAEVNLANGRLQAFNAANDGSNQSLAETARLNREAAAAVGSFSDQSAAETARLSRQANAQADALKEVGEAFKTLGVNPTKINNDVTAIIDAFKRISDDPSVTGETLVAGLEGAIKKVRDSGSLQTLRIEFAEAFGAGRISVEQLYAGLGELDKAQEKLDKSAGKNVESAADRSEALKKEAKAAEDAQRAAQQYALELEKLASNERVKLIEARVTLNVTEVQEQTKRIQAAFESLDNTVNSTANVINESFGLFAKLGQDSADSRVRDRLFDQIDIENRNRESALEQQKKLNEAQIKVMEAQARNLESGEALIKVDGSGLAPHLEAIMWEIMKLVQVRTNRDGLKLLLGV
jgi:tape measure domain-containing protein